MSDRDDLPELDGDRIATTEARLEGFYWVILGQNPPEIAYWERGEWWLAGDPKPWLPEAVTVASDGVLVPDVQKVTLRKLSDFNWLAESLRRNSLKDMGFQLSLAVARLSDA